MVQKESKIQRPYQSVMERVRNNIRISKILLWFCSISGFVCCQGRLHNNDSDEE